MGKLKIGVVGCGAIGRQHIARINEKFANAEIVAVSDIFVEGARKIGEPLGASIYNNSSDLVYDDDVEAIICTSATFAHREILLQAIEAGKPIFVEKPMTLSAAESKAVVDAEVRGGKHLVQVGFVRRYDHGYLSMKQLLDSGDFGESLYSRTALWNQSVTRDYDNNLVITDAAVIDIDTQRWLLNDEYEAVQVFYPKQSKRCPAGLNDPQILMLHFKSGRIATMEIFMNAKFGYDHKCEIICEDGTIDLPSIPYPTYRRNGGMTVPVQGNWQDRFALAYDAEIKDWIDSTIKGEVNGPTAWDGYVVNATMKALLASQVSGEKEPVILSRKPDFYSN